MCLSGASKSLRCSIQERPTGDPLLLLKGGVAYIPDSSTLPQRLRALSRSQSGSSSTLFVASEICEPGAVTVLPMLMPLLPMDDEHRLN